MEGFPEELALKNGSTDWAEFGIGYAEKGNGHSRCNKRCELRQQEWSVNIWLDFSICARGPGWISKSGKDF